MSVAEYRSGPESGRTPSRGQCAASVMTSHPAGGANATATSSLSTQQSLALACLSLEPHIWIRLRCPKPRAPDMPVSIQARLFAAFGLELIYNKQDHQVSIYATITPSTPAALVVLFVEDQL